MFVVIKFIDLSNQNQSKYINVSTLHYYGPKLKVKLHSISALDHQNWCLYSEKFHRILGCFTQETG